MAITVSVNTEQDAYRVGVSHREDGIMFYPDGQHHRRRFHYARGYLDGKPCGSEAAKRTEPYLAAAKRMAMQ